MRLGLRQVRGVDFLRAGRLDATAPLAHQGCMADLHSLAGPLALPASGAAPRSLVILLHGYASNGADMIAVTPYWRDALPDTLFIAPNAPQSCPDAPGGYQWWPLTSQEPAALAAGVREPDAMLNAFIDEQLKRYRLADHRLALVGFSQGTMVALHVGPRRMRPLAGIIGYSGMLADPAALAAEVRSKPPVLLVHGQHDHVLPVAALHETETALSTLGFMATAYISPLLGHSIDEDGLRLGEQFLREVLP
jgi:phospholipase/carboxylesterase